MLRWKLEVDADGPNQPGEPVEVSLSSVKQCSEVGLSRVRVSTRGLDDVLVDQREYPCFVPAFAAGELAPGPELEPGEYSVEIEGLRRTGEPWPCVIDPDDPDPAACVARAERSVTVSEEGPPVQLDDIVLVAPPQCDDGIDNDGDGHVDLTDPACLVDLSDAESADLGVVVFQLSLTFLDSEIVTAANVGVGWIRLWVDLDADGVIDGEDAPDDADVDFVFDIPAHQIQEDVSPFRLPLVAERFDSGSYELQVIALSGDKQAVTEAAIVPFTADEQLGGFQLATINFGEAQFLEPIVEPLSFTWSLLTYPGALAKYCDPPGDLVIDRLRVRVTDTSVDPPAALDDATLDLTTGSNTSLGNRVEEPNGWIAFDCAATSLRSAELVWGSYALEMQAQAAGSTCFATAAPLEVPPLGSGSVESLYIERVLEGDAPPPGCADCQQDADCGDLAAYSCENNICVGR